MPKHPPPLIARTGTLAEVVRLVITAAAEVLDAEGASILLLNEERQELDFVMATGEQEDILVQFSLKLGQGVAGWVALERKPTLVEDTSKDSRFYAGVDTKSRFTTRTLVAVPLLMGDKLIGVLESVNKRNGRSFTEADLRTLELLGWLVAIGIENSRASEDLRRENRALLEERPVTSSVIATSPAMQRVMTMVRRVADSTSTVLLTGESGTGKEVIARTIHQSSSRGEHAFVRVNCGAIPGPLLESELFGYEKGAFTGAVGSKMGRFELANGGTLFLDEIGEVDMSLQVKLLRAIQEKEFERLGGIKTIHVNVRIIAATNRDLTRMVEEGRFREDLYYRLNVVPIYLPPLRERVEEIPELVRYFLDKHCRELQKQVRSLAPGVLEALMSYRWPGNIRELENVLERMIVLSEGRELTSAALPAEISGESRGTVGETSRPTETPVETGDNVNALSFTLGSQGLRDMERLAIEAALRRAGNNQARAARLLRISRDNLRYRVRKYGIAVVKE